MSVGSKEPDIGLLARSLQTQTVDFKRSRCAAYPSPEAAANSRSLGNRIVVRGLRPRDSAQGSSTGH